MNKKKIKMPYHYTGICGSFKVVLLALALPLWLTACGGGGEGDTAFSATSTSSGSGGDGASPIVSITSPSSGSTYNSSSASITLAGTASDNVGLNQVAWSNNLGGSGVRTVSGTNASWSFNVTLQSGANVITVTARDTSGRTGQRQLTVNYAPSTSNTAALTWDVSAGGSVYGYRVYYGTAPGVYAQARGDGINVGDVINHTVTGLSNGTRYYFAVTAYDAMNNESPYSNEVYKDIP